MDFFEQQDIARRSSSRLIFLFVLAVLALVLLTNGLIYFLFSHDIFFASFTGYRAYDLTMFLTVSMGVITVIALASLYRIASLRGGGQAVAESMGGELLVASGDDLILRRLLNVVEEMAIASGTPVPPVYLIDDDAINAFAAGYSPADAVIGITRGAVRELNREQLQGVIAHEFSHILNGDMRLNIHLMGVLFGILVVATVGRLLAHGSSVRGSGSRRSGGSSASAGLALAGVGLMLVGYTGKFFGSLIKAGVSRQREYLADASAVQFTRNPKGIADALKRIAGYSSGSEVKQAGSDEISHMFFANGVGRSWLQWLATHPPIDERISRIDKSWNGQYLFDSSVNPVESEPLVAGFVPGQNRETASPNRSAQDVEALVSSIGQLSATGLVEASQTLANVPAALMTAVHEPYSARAVIYLLLIHADNDIRNKQLGHIQQHGDLGVHDELQRLLPFVAEARQQRMVLMEVAAGTLRQLSRQQYRLFSNNLAALIRANGKISLQEWTVKTYMTAVLDATLLGKQSKRMDRELNAMKPQIQLVLSLLAYTDNSAALPPEDCFNHGAAMLDLKAAILPRGEVRFKNTEQALRDLAEVHPLRKPQLLKACLSVIVADNRITQTEQETMRVFAAVLDCPMPVIQSD